MTSAKTRPAKLARARPRTARRLSHESVRQFLREVHEAAAVAGMADLNLCISTARPWRSSMGIIAAATCMGCGADSTRVSHVRERATCCWDMPCELQRQGDRVYDMGVGSFESKKNFLTRMVPISVTATIRRWPSDAIAAGETMVAGPENRRSLLKRNATPFSSRRHGGL